MKTSFNNYSNSKSNVNINSTLNRLQCGLNGVKAWWWLSMQNRILLFRSFERNHPLIFLTRSCPYEMNKIKYCLVSANHQIL